MFEVWSIVLLFYYWKFTAEYASERILTIDHHFVKLEPKI